jgi:hypothetical protein
MLDSKSIWGIIALVAGIALTPSPAFSQAENVPAHDPVMHFLKAMDVKGLLDTYDDAVLPISRAAVARYLAEVQTHRAELSHVEQEWVDSFLSEYRYDLTGSTSGFDAWLSSSGTRTDSVGGGFHPRRERVAILHADSAVTLFVNGLLSVDARRISGDALGSEGAEFLEVGFKARGTLLGHLGYTFRMTNAQFWGSRELLALDERLAQSHALGVGNIQNFDEAEASVRYDAGFLSLQVGRERVLWGTGYFEKMVLSDHPRPFDHIRADLSYGVFRYSFLHAWILGSGSKVFFHPPGDSSTSLSEPVIADKYFAAHRFGLSLPGVVDVGFQETVVYSNRSVDLAYLSPLSFTESYQRSRGERDNVMWTFDVRTRFMRGYQVHASILYDDINVPDMFSDLWTDRYAWQVGVVCADPIGIPNTLVAVEYTRVEAYVFSHGRSRDDSYTSLGRVLGPAVGPNGDTWQFGATVTPRWNLSIAANVLLGRHGNNINGFDGMLLRNVGGDILMPHRGQDAERKTFLDGDLEETTRVELAFSWEFFGQMSLEGLYRYASVRYPNGYQFVYSANVDPPSRDTKDHFGSIRLRFEL